MDKKDCKNTSSAKDSKPATKTTTGCKSNSDKKSDK